MPQTHSTKRASAADRAQLHSVHASGYLRRARDSYDRREWRSAYEALVVAERTAPLGVDDLERLATAAYMVGRNGEFEGCLERLHRIHVEAGDPSRAARCAFWLCLSLLLRGEAGQSNAWTVRGHRLIEDLDCAERGYLLLPLAEHQLGQGNADAAQTTAAAAAEIGHAFRDPDLMAAARHVQGRALVQQNRILAGLALLDEVMLAATGNELSPIMTGLMYCSVIEVCREVYALSRAREWTFALSRWCEQQSEMFAFTGICLVHRAEIMQFHGAWPDALAEALRACERSSQANRRPPAAALYQRAEIHRLRGEFAEADEGYRAASQSGYDPQPGLALLRLAQGRVDASCAAIRRLVSATSDQLQRARLLPAYVEIMLASGDIDEARHACRELQTVSELCDADALRAAAAHGQGATGIAEGNPSAALGPLRRAFEVWTRLDVPYESARVRVLIGEACRALGDEEAMALEFAAARAAFERLGAHPELTRLNSLELPKNSRDAHPLTARERDVLRLIAGGRTNKAIAAELRVSGRTIDRHVSNILGKLDVPSRAAATAYAYEHKLFN